MCNLCASTQPWVEDCFYGDLADETGVNGNVLAATPEYTPDQIATYLTNGYWGGSSRSFDVSVGDTLYVDITGLTANGQAMARQALDAWSHVTGLNFAEVNGASPPSATVAESGDAANGVSTDHTMNVGEDMTGTLGVHGDRDTVAVYLTAGQAVTVTLEGEGEGALEDPYLFVMNGAGSILAQNDDVDNGPDAALTYQAQYTGYHYIQAAAFDDGGTGDYLVSVRAEGAEADITFDDENSGAYASSSYWNGTIHSSFVNIDPGWAGGQARTDGYFYQTYIHEIGHALGLGHAGGYNGSATYGVHNHYSNDSWQMSVMSYFDQGENSSVDADFAYVIGPQLADILAVQSLYGTPTSASPGDTIYGDGGNSGTHLDGAHDLSRPVSYTVFDTGGTDLFDFSGSSAHQRMDLREENFSDLDGYDGNVGIARGTVIENGRTGSGNDEVTGNNAGNELRAGSGSDLVQGKKGNDAILGEGGNDTLFGHADADLIDGGGGDDDISGGNGGDLLFGDDITLVALTTIFPTWTPPANAQDLIDDGDLMVIWEDLVDEFAFA